MKVCQPHCINPYANASDWGRQIGPVGLHYALVTLYERYEVPLAIVENGFGAIDTLEKDGTCHDPYRVEKLDRLFRTPLFQDFMGLLRIKRRLNRK